MINQDLKNFYNNLSYLLIGFISFFTIVGLEFLIPKNTEWLIHHDYSPAYLGWEFYRKSQITNFILGSNYLYGTELSSSILYSDSLPLFAIPLKFLFQFYEYQFQYFGIWLLLCFCFHSFFSAKIIELFSKDKFTTYFFTFLFIFMPSFLFQIPHHLTLSGHWLIIASIYFYLFNKVRSQNKLFGINSICFLALLVHPYIFFITLSICILNFFEVRNRIANANLLILFFLISISILAWQSGYFLGDNTSACCYGRYGLSITSVIDPFVPTGTDYKWSYILPNIVGQNGWGPGFNYLGLGFILIILFYHKILIKNFKSYLNQKKYRYLLIFLFFTTIFSITHRIEILGLHIDVPLPEFFLKFLGTFRASGRFFWTVNYFIIIFVLISLIKFKYNKKILFIFMIIQILDTSAGWKKINLMMNDYNNEKENPLILDNIEASNYKSLIQVPFKNHRDNWEKYALFSLENNLSTNIVYLARVSDENIDKFYNNFLNQLNNNKIDNKVIYILSKEFYHELKDQFDLQNGKIIYFDDDIIFLPTPTEKININD